MHLKGVRLHPDHYPTQDHYPFNLPVFHQTTHLAFGTPVTLFVGENGTGKSTLLEALAHAGGIHIWRDDSRAHFAANLDEEELHRYLSLDWIEERATGSFFGSAIFQHFAQILDEWAAADPGQLQYFGGRSLRTQSHGQSLMAFFRHRFQRPGLYLLDEPETALSPRSQLELLEILAKATGANQAQFIIATHSPLLLACPGAIIYSFDHNPVTRVEYEETEPYQVYKSFLMDRARYLPPQ